MTITDKELNIDINTPREIVCIRSDNSVWKEGGDPDHLLEVGKTYHIRKMTVYSDYTIVVLDELPGHRFNSVLFGEKDG